MISFGILLSNSFSGCGDSGNARILRVAPLMLLRLLGTRDWRRDIMIVSFTSLVYDDDDESCLSNFEFLFLRLCKIAYHFDKISTLRRLIMGDMRCMILANDLI